MLPERTGSASTLARLIRCGTRATHLPERTDSHPDVRRSRSEPLNEPDGARQDEERFGQRLVEVGVGPARLRSHVPPVEPVIAVRRCAGGEVVDRAGVADQVVIPVRWPPSGADLAGIPVVAIGRVGVRRRGRTTSRLQVRCWVDSGRPYARFDGLMPDLCVKFWLAFSALGTACERRHEASRKQRRRQEEDVT